MWNNINRKLDILLPIIVFTAILVLVFKQYYEQKQINKYTKKTTGTIIEIHQNKHIDYSLKYEYFVDGVRFESSIGISFFKCKDGTAGCVGSEFPVYYSSKNPEYSVINLLQYEGFQETVKF